MQKEIGKTAGAIWDALNTRGEQSLSQLKKAENGRQAGLEITLPVGRCWYARLFRSWLPRHCISMSRKQTCL